MILNDSYCINPLCKQRDNPATASSCLACGTSLLICDRYRIIKPIRSPNSALPTDIFEVADWGTDKGDWGTVKILKVLKNTHNSYLVRSFQQEARVLIWLAGTQGIPAVAPDGFFSIKPQNSSQKLFCLAIEKISGENLLELLDKKQYISQKIAVDWLKQLTNILQNIHKYHLVHRDIKPSNLMLQPNGKLGLIDFGSVVESGMNATPAGSAGYAAPEQIAGKAEARSDFFAMGRTFVHLLTGMRPIDFPKDEKTGKINWKNQSVKIDNFLADFLDKLMEPLPEKRPKNTEVILDKLNSITCAEPK
ncbi:MAG: protein kinase [Oscillatoriaceae cyanobacterium Prado104]|jgi:serine/threonine protein kinase|nr:protein kinase [Oscillatoriaceae cyanobacterium Prado104]